MTRANHMYQAEPDTAAPLDDHAALEAALALIAERGLKGATMRAVAERAGISPALISYRHGSREAFFVQAFALGRARDHARRGRWARRLEGLALTPADLPVLVHAVMREDFVDARVCALARCEARRDAERSERFRAIASAGAQDATVFWAQVLGRVGVDEALAQFVAAAAHAIGQGYLLHAEPSVFDPWSRDLIDRLCERLATAKPARPGDSPWRGRALARSQASEARGSGGSAASGARDDAVSATRLAIIEATADLIVEGGADAVTHRAIAKRSGVSLSSTTHHFATRDDILQAAYCALRDCAVARSDLTEGALRPLTLASLEAGLRRLIDETDGAGAFAEHQALRELMAAAARADAARPMALAMFARAGETSERLLAALAEKRVVADRLDAHLFSLIAAELAQSAALREDASASGSARLMCDCIRALFC